MYGTSLSGFMCDSVISFSFVGVNFLEGSDGFHTNCEHINCIKMD